ncbi:MAG TPA: ABC transporter ATP-binding protein [Thermoleophilia bacterium]|nr:ABC transporter ATP-binding protein [Thermoleophilia bacterium]
MTAVSLRGVGKAYGGDGARTFAALRDVDLDVEVNDFLVITGRSGCGKTTLLNIATGLATPTSGTVTVGGVDIWSISDAERSSLRNRTMGFVFQFPSLIPGLTLEQNVMLPLEFSHEEHVDARERARDLLDMVGLGERLAALPRELSAGQQQRVVIARALINRPTLLLADEPSSDLDEQTEAEIMEIFRRIHAEQALTVMMVTHTRKLVAFGTRHLEMADGTVREVAASEGSSDPA